MHTFIDNTVKVEKLIFIIGKAGGMWLKFQTEALKPTKYSVSYVI